MPYVLYGQCAPPTATTPQRFCGNGTVSDLVASGANLQWYDSEESSDVLTGTHPLVTKTYYVSQCGDNSERTAVRVEITDKMVLDAPVINSYQTLCPPATLADIATDGSNIIWYDAPFGGNLLPLNTPLEDYASYFAAIVAGDCQSIVRAEVGVNVSDYATIQSPYTTTPQYFYCSYDLDRVVANLETPNNKILWYPTETGGTPLLPDEILQEGTYYYAAQVAGSCESVYRSRVEISIVDSLPVPQIRGFDGTCGLTNNCTIADIRFVGGYNISWYYPNDYPPRLKSLPPSTPVSGTPNYFASYGGVKFIGSIGTVGYLMDAIGGAVGRGGVTDPFTLCDCPAFSSHPIPISPFNVLPENTPLEAGGTYNCHCYLYDRFGDCCTGSCANILVDTAYYETLIFDNHENPRITFFVGRTISTLHKAINSSYYDIDTVVWIYDVETGGDSLLLNTPLVSGTTYYARFGDYESPRIPVFILSGNTHYVIGGNASPFLGRTIATVRNKTDFKGNWYDAKGGNELPLTTPLVPGTTYYTKIAGAHENLRAVRIFSGRPYEVVQTSSGGCTSIRRPIFIPDGDYTIQGTIFPFVHTGNPDFDALFPVIVKLHAVPIGTGKFFDPLVAIKRSRALHTTIATYYDGTNYIPGTPKNPGTIGATNNPGELINWKNYLGKTQGAVDDTPVTGHGDIPTAPVGMYKFENVVPGQYVLEISRKGFISRYFSFSVDDHKELLAGDVNGDETVGILDLSIIRTKQPAIYGTPGYDPRFDLNGDGVINSRDNSIIFNNMGANPEIYQDTKEWIESYFY